MCPCYLKKMLLSDHHYHQRTEQQRQPQVLSLLANWWWGEGMSSPVTQAPLVLTGEIRGPVDVTR